MSNLKTLSPTTQTWLNRELSRAQMIVSSPCGLWPDSLVQLSRQLLNQWAGWNVSSLPTASAQLPSGAQNTAPAGALSELPVVLAEMRERRAKEALYRAEFDMESG